MEAQRHALQEAQRHALQEALQMSIISDNTDTYVYSIYIFGLFQSTHSDDTNQPPGDYLVYY
jgi:hypothetical protein